MDEGAGGQGGRPTGGRSANFRNFRKRSANQRYRFSSWFGTSTK